MGLGKLVIRVPCQHLRVPVRQFEFRLSFEFVSFVWTNERAVRRGPTGTWTQGSCTRGEPLEFVL